MSHRYVSTKWVPPPERIVSWHSDDDYSEPSVELPASTTAGPARDMEYDHLTHNINLSITTNLGNDSMKKSVPDGSVLVRYREPDRESFIFDPRKGNFFDPTTGLHYNANSGLFLNYEHGVILRWDSLLNSYIKVGILTTPFPHSQPKAHVHGRGNLEKKRPQDDGMDMSMFGGTKRELWNRLGPSSKRGHSGTTNHCYTDREIEESARSRKVRLVHLAGDRSNQDSVECSLSIKDDCHNPIKREVAMDVSVAPDEAEACNLDIGGPDKGTTRPPKTGSGTSLPSKEASIYHTKVVRPSTKESKRSRHKDAHVERDSLHLGWASKRNQSKDTTVRSRHTARPSIRQHGRSCHKEAKVDFQKSAVCYNKEYRRSRSKEATSRRTVRNKEPLRSHSRDFRRGSVEHDNWESRRSCRRVARSTSRDIVRRNRESRKSWSRESMERRRGHCRESGRSLSRERRDRLGQSPPRAILLYRKSSRSWSRDAADFCRKMARSRSRELRRSLSWEDKNRRDWSPDAARCGDTKFRRSWSREIISQRLQTGRNSNRKSRHLGKDPRRSPGIETVRSCSSVVRSDKHRMTARSSKRSRPQEHRRSFSISPLPLKKTHQSRSIAPGKSTSQASTKSCTRNPDIMVSRSPSCDVIASDSETESLRCSANSESSPTPLDPSPIIQKVGVSNNSSCPSLAVVKTPIDNGHSSKFDPNQRSTKLGKTQNSLAKPHKPILLIENKSIPIIEPSNPTVKIPPGNSEVAELDEGNVLAPLFNLDSVTCTNVVLVAPVPLQNHSKCAKDALKNQIGNPPGLRKVYVTHESMSGSPCSYILISFMKTSAAKNWYDSHEGFLILSGSNGLKLKGYLHFLKKGNWNCQYCKSFNFFMQTLCSKCYRAKDNTFSPITVCAQPSKWVGVTKLGSRFMTAQDFIKSLPPLSSFNISSTDLISDPNGLPLGLCVFEVESAKVGSELREFFLSLKKNAVYVTVHKKAGKEEYLSSMFDKIKSSNHLLVALIFDKIRGIIPLHVMESNLKLVEMNLLKQLEEDGVKYEKITSHIYKKVGAPYCYVLITFADTKSAVDWFKLRCNTFNNFSGEHCTQFLNVTYRISPHLAENNWECPGCHSLNFSLRSLCHHCFKPKDQNKLGLISQSLVATKWLGVSEFSNWSGKNECVVKNLRELSKGFMFKQIEVLRDDNCPLLPLACVFEMPNKAESMKLRKCLHAENMHCVFVVPHKELSRCSGTDALDESDLLIVEAPPLDFVDLTIKAETQLNEKLLSPAPATSIVEQPSPVSLASPTCERELSSSVVNSSSEVARVCEEPECVDLTEEADSQLTEQSSTCFPEIAPPVDQMPVENPVIATNEGVNPNTESANSLGVLKQVPAVSTQKTVNILTKNVINSVVTTESEVISVCPVPRLQGDSQWLYALAFLKYGAKFTSVEYCEGDSFGVPYNYCLVHFTSPETAKLWCTKHRGSIRINKKYFPKQRKLKDTKAFLNFSEKNWQCNCGRENCWTRSICFNCLKPKGAEVEPFIQSPTPTKYLAVKLFKWHDLQELTYLFPGNIEGVVNSYNARVIRGSVLNVKLISDPWIRKDKFGIYIFETISSAGAISLLDYFKQSLLVESASFVVMMDLTVGAILYRGSPYSPVIHSTTGANDSNASKSGTPAILDSRNLAVVCQQQQQQRVEPSTSLCVLNNQTVDTVQPATPSDNDSSLANVIDSSPAIIKMPNPDYEAIIWTSFFGFHLNQPPTRAVMIPLCLDYRELPDGPRAIIQNSLKEVDVSPLSIIFSHKRDVGSPFSYCMILFYTMCSAKKWFDKCNDESFLFEVSRPDDKKIPLTIQDCYSHVDSPNGDASYFIKSKLYYSLPNWNCSCGRENFPLRSVCHSCVKNKDKTGWSSVSCPTKLLGIKLTKHLEAMDTSSFYLVRRLGFTVSKIHVGLDAAVPRDPYGIVIFEMLSVKDCVKFHKFLTRLIRGEEMNRHPLLKNLLEILDHSSGIIFLK